MSERLTETEMADFVLLLDCARADGDPDSDAGRALDEFLDNSNIKRMADELIERRAADLSAEDIGALRNARVCVDNVNPGVTREERQRALAALDKLIAAGGKP